LPAESALLQYVDDLFIASETEEGCKQDAVALFRHLAEHGHKANPKKLQWCQSKVVFLGHNLSAKGKALTDKRVQAIRNIPKPQTAKQIKSFLGMTSYCKMFIQNYTCLEGPLSAIAHGPGILPGSKVTWTPAAAEAFKGLKIALLTNTLGLPDPTRPFTQVVDVKNGYMGLASYGVTRGSGSSSSIV